VLVGDRGGLQRLPGPAVEMRLEPPASASAGAPVGLLSERAAN